MIVRLLAFPLSALLLVQLSPTGAQAQNHDETHDGSIANHEIHLFDAADFGIDPEAVTYSKDIAPILQRSCVNCHREGGGAPMSLRTYEEVAPWAQMIRFRTAIRDRMGAMPPFFVEKHIGVTKFKNDPSLSDEELARIQAWADNGAPEGDPDDLPPPVEFGEEGAWSRTWFSALPRSRDRPSDPTGGVIWAWCPRASPKIDTCRRSRCGRSTTSRRMPEPAPWAAATSSTT